MRQQESPTQCPSRPLELIRQIYDSLWRVGDLAQKSYPRPNYPGGTLAIILDRPIS